MRRPAFRILLLSLASLFFGWQTWRAWTLPPGPEGPPAAGGTFVPREPSDPGEAEPGGPPGLDVGAIVARPLFRPDRQPYRKEGGVLSGRNYEAELGKFTLLGVLLLGEDRKAVVSDRTPGRSNSWEVGAGDALPGFTVKKIETDGVVLEADGRTFTLPLYAGAPKSAGGPVRTGTEAPTAPAPRAPASAGPPAVPSPAPRQPVFQPPPSMKAVPTRELPPGLVPGSGAAPQDSPTWGFVPANRRKRYAPRNP